MTSWASPVDDMGGGMWSGGGARPWWDFPAPLGVPKLANTPGACFVEQYAPNAELFGMPVNCGPLFGPGHVFNGDEWATWFQGP